MKLPYFLLPFLIFYFAGQGRCQQPSPADERGQTRAEVLALEQAIQQALDNNRTLKIVSLDILRAEDSIAATRTHLFPTTSLNVLGSELVTQLRFQVSQGQFGTFPSTGPIPAQSTFITTPRRLNAYIVAQVAQPLSQLYKVKLRIHQGEFARDVDRQKLRAQQQNIIDSVKKLYFAALDDENALEAAEESLKTYRELDRVVGEYFLEKVVLKSESLEVKARLAKEEYDAMTLRNSLATTKDKLNLALGRDIRTEFILNPLPEPAWTETNLAAAHARAIDQRPEIQEARLKFKQAEQDRRIKKAEYIPDVSIAFNYLSPGGIKFVPKNIAVLGLQFSWEPWDWGRKKHELDEKSRQIEQARQSLQDAEQQVLVDANQKYRKLEESRALVHVAEMARDAEREKLRVIQSKFAEKAALLKDVLLEQSVLGEANYNYRKAILGFWTAKAEFEKALGEGQ